MQTEYFWEFLILSETKSYQATAKRLFLSEPTLFRHIKALEDEYGVPLFDRSGKILELNEYGAALVPHARKMVDTMANSHTALKNLTERSKTALKISSTYPISGLIAAFSRDNPEISCELIRNNGNTNLILEDLCSGKVDCALIRDCPEDDRLERIHLISDYYAAVVGAGHYLSTRKSVAISELSHENFITFPSDHECTQTLLRLCCDNGFEPNIVAVSETAREIVSILKYGGVSILMGNAIRRHTKMTNNSADSFVIIDLNPHIEINIYLVYPKNRSLCSSAELFFKYIKDTYLPANFGILT